jgi:type IV pilus assembly protein PilC
MGFKIESHIATKAETVKGVEAKTQKKEQFWNKELSFVNSFGDKKKERFYLDLRVLLVAGVDLKSAIEIIIEEQQKDKEKVIFEAIYNDIIKGKPLADALKNTGKFSDYEYYSIKIGEETNRLNQVLEELMKYYADQSELKKQVISVMTYPLFVFGITIGLVYFMMTSVVPMFADVFKQFGGDLPPLTKKIVYISNNFPFYVLVFSLSVTALIVLVYTQKNQEWFRKSVSSIALRIPKVGQLIKLVYLARFTQSMQLLLSSKTPLVRSLDLTSKMIKFYPLQMAIIQMAEDIKVGKSLHSGMAQFNIFPNRMLSLIKVGEEVNQLEMILQKLSDQYQEDLKHQTKLIGKLMEPIIILIIGGIVGVILVAMYMPMFNLSNVMIQ